MQMPMEHEELHEAPPAREQVAARMHELEQSRLALLNAMEDMLAESQGRKLAEKQVRDNEARLQSLVRVLQTPNQDEQSFLDNALREAIKLTNSTIGYIYFYNEDKTEMVLNAWSPEVLELCAIQNPLTVYQLEATGIWGEAVRQRKEIVINDFRAEPAPGAVDSDGHVQLENFMTIPVFSGDHIVAVVGVANKASDYDNTDVLQLRLLMDGVWKQVEVLRGFAERQRLLAAIEQTDDVVLITNVHGEIEYVNPAFEVVSGYTREEVLGRTPRILSSGDHDKDYYDVMWQALLQGETWRGQLVNKHKSGTLYTEDVTITPVKNDAGQVISYLAVKRDVTNLLRMQAEHEQLEEQFQQSQKLESVGRLAGGVAHDFNNMLQAILGYAEIALEQVPEDSPLHDDLEQICKIGLRSADLTRQLLAFARRQTIAPRVLDLNETVESMLKFLRRVIGEHIELIWKPGSGRYRVKMDPSQLDQLLANLCVNARDAIKEAGVISIETLAVSLDTRYASKHPDAVAGEYAVLQIRDNGCGIAEDVREHIFEPFFTTKARGEGTGLGLATVYGIVRQNEGFIQLDTAPGQGATFRLYIPLQDGEEQDVVEIETDAVSAHGTETILLVEDEMAVRKTMARFLENLGYTVLVVADPRDALALATDSAVIHLLLTDVIMPGMSGRELAAVLTKRCPAMKVVYMSGYTADVIANQGVLEDGVNFIAKPIDRVSLARRVRAILDA